MPEVKKYLDFEGLQTYDAKLKEWVRSQVGSSSTDSLQNRVQELENQMIVNSEASDGANDFCEIEPENSSDSVVIDYE